PAVEHAADDRREMVEMVLERRLHRVQHDRPGNLVMQPFAGRDVADPERNDAEAGAAGALRLALYLQGPRAPRGKDQQADLAPADRRNAGRHRLAVIAAVAGCEPAQVAGPLERGAGRLGNRAILCAMADE